MNICNVSSKRAPSHDILYMINVVIYIVQCIDVEHFVEKMSLLLGLWFELCGRKSHNVTINTRFAYCSPFY